MIEQSMGAEVELAGLAELRRALISRAMAEADHPAIAVAVLMQAASDILCQVFPPELAAAMIVQSVNDAVAMMTPAGRA